MAIFTTIITVLYLILLCVNALTQMWRTEHNKIRVILHSFAAFISLASLMSLALAYILEHKI